MLGLGLYISAAASLISAIVERGLQMFLPFSSSILNANGQFSLDETTNNNNAKLFTGNCLDFDGSNDYVDIDGFTMIGTTATFAFWINTDDISSDRHILDFDTNRFIITFNSNQLSVYDSSETYYGFGAISTNAWNRCVIVLNGTSAKCYVNGAQLGAEKTITPLSVGSATAVKIGARHNASPSEALAAIDGQLSDFQIWNSAWSATDVANDYANPNQLVSSVSVSNLKGWWALTEGSGSFAFDNATAPGSELIVNGDFDTDSDWSKGTGWSISGNVASSDGSQSGNSYLNQSGAIVSGKTYKATFEIKAISAGEVRIFVGNVETFTPRTTVDVFTEYITAGSNEFWIRASSTFVGSIDNVSVKEISAGTINGATYVDSQSSILQLGMINWSNGSNVFLPPSPTNSAQDILGNAVRDRLNSLNLTGTGYGEVADDDSINPTDAITIQCWIKSNTEGNKGLVGKFNSSKKDYLFLKQSTKIKFQIGDSDFLESGTIAQSGWINVAGTYDKSNIKTFINGVESTTASLTVAISNKTNVLEIGRYNNNNSYAYSERIDDVKIYDRALTADEILQNYNAGTSAHTN